MKRMKRHYFAALACVFFFSCSDFSKNFNALMHKSSPVLAPLSISQTTSNSITLDRPAFQEEGNPAATVKAYIGVSGTLAVSGSSVTVNGAAASSVDVSSGAYVFTSLANSTLYDIAVVAENELGYWVRTIQQSTAERSPKLNNLSVTIGSGSITLVKPSLSLTGNPIPAVQAWIGQKGTISVSGPTVSGFVTGPVDVSAGDYAFNGLDAATQYTIVVVAKNSSGYDTRSISAGITGSAPKFFPLSVSNVGTSSITLSQPEFSTAGSPTVSVEGWIGLHGSLTIAGSAVTGTSLYTNTDVSLGWPVAGLSPYTRYDVIVKASNGSGYDFATFTVWTAAQKRIIDFGFTSPVTVACSVDDTLHTITGNVPFYYDIDNLAATFTLPASTTLKVGTTAQLSGTTTNDFYNSVTTPVVYTATWADGTTQNYDVMISNYGTVSTPALTNQGDGDLYHPLGMATDGTDLYIANYGFRDVVRAYNLTSSAADTKIYAGQKGISGDVYNVAMLSARFVGPRGICYNSSTGNFYLVDDSTFGVRELAVLSGTVNPLGTVSPTTPYDISGDSADLYIAASDGRIKGGNGAYVNINTGGVLTGAVAVAWRPGFVEVSTGSRIVSLQIIGGTYTALVGDASSTGFVDDIGSAARFNGVRYMTYDGAKTCLYVTDYNNCAVRKVNRSTGKVTTIAGNGTSGSADGTGPSAKFGNPAGIALIGNVLYVADYSTGAIRRIQ